MPTTDNVSDSPPGALTGRIRTRRIVQPQAPGSRPLAPIQVEERNVARAHRIAADQRRRAKEAPNANGDSKA
jgi:hypothetical protein